MVHPKTLGTPARHRTPLRRLPLQRLHCGQLVCRSKGHLSCDRCSYVQGATSFTWQLTLWRPLPQPHVALRPALAVLLPAAPQVPPPAPVLLLPHLPRRPPPPPAQRRMLSTRAEYQFARIADASQSPAYNRYTSISRHLQLGFLRLGMARETVGLGASLAVFCFTFVTIVPCASSALARPASGNRPWCPTPNTLLC